MIGYFSVAEMVRLRPLEKVDLDLPGAKKEMIHEPVEAPIDH